MAPLRGAGRRQYLMINEDGATESRAVMAAKGRDGSIWRFVLVNRRVGVDASTPTRVAQLDPPGRDGIPVGPGVWRPAASSTPRSCWRRQLAV